MEAFISTLILTLVVFLNVDEFYAAKRKVEESSLLPPSSRKSGKKMPLNLEGLIHKTVLYNQKLPIQVWIDPKGSGTRVVHADFIGNNVPNGFSYIHGRFVTCLVNVENIKLVGYFRQDGSLIAVRPPRVTAHRNRFGYEPNDSRWYITYDGHTFKVTGNFAEGRPISINLEPKNLLEGEELKHGVIRKSVHMLGVNFIIVRGELTNQVLGAELDMAANRQSSHAD